MDNDISFFQKWATSCGHCQRVTSRGHFLFTSRGQKSSFWVNFRGHFLMVMMNSANRRAGGGSEALARLSKG